MASPPRTRKGSMQSDNLADLRLLIKESKKEVISVLSADLKSVTQRLDSLSSRFTALEESVAAINKKHESLESEMTAVRSDLCSVTENCCKIAFSEMDSRMLKMSNIIIRGLPEEHGTVDERVHSDEEAVKAMLTFLEVEPVSVVGVRRMGKPPKGKPRLLRATLTDPIRRQEVLRKAKHLKNSHFKEVFLQADLTQTQRDVERNLRKELHDRRENGEDVVIYAGEIRSRHELRKGFRH